MKSNKINYILSIILIVTGLSILMWSYLFSPPKVTDLNYKNLKKLHSISDDNPLNFSFAVFGDNKNSYFLFPKLIRRINDENISFSIETGDFIDNIFDGNSEYNIFLKQINNIKKPFFTIPGNHETEGFSSAYYYLFGKNYYSFSYKNSYFILLDGSHETGIGPEQLNWLKDELKRSTKYEHSFVFMHIPLYDPQEGSYAVGHSMSNIEQARELNELFDQFNVTNIFTAHIHGYFRGKWHNTPFIITGGAGAELGGTEKGHYFNHYILVNVRGHQVDYKVIKVKEYSNIVFMFIHNVIEFMTTYIVAHWDILLVLIGVLYLCWSVGILSLKNKEKNT